MGLVRCSSIPSLYRQLQALNSPSRTDDTHLQSLFLTESHVWRDANEKIRADVADNDDVSGMLDRTGLLDKIDSLFIKKNTRLPGKFHWAAEPVEKFVLWFRLRGYRIHDKRCITNFVRPLPPHYPQWVVFFLIDVTW